jgi:ATP-dependent protease HslVU (ClpYQ) ATPase subunit
MTTDVKTIESRTDAQVEEKVEITFDLVEETEMPKTTYVKGSKYDTILDKFIVSSMKLVSISMPDEEANYLRTQIKKRLDSRKLNDSLIASVVNNKVYLQKKMPPTPTVTAPKDPQ